MDVLKIEIECYWGTGRTGATLWGNQYNKLERDLPTGYGNKKSLQFL